MQTKNNGATHTARTFKTVGIVVGILVLLVIASNFVDYRPRETYFYKVQQYLTYSKEDWNNYEANQKLLALTPVGSSSDTTAVLAAEDLYSYDTNRVTEAAKAEELLKIKNAHFENLTVATNAPSDEAAQEALIRLTNGRLATIVRDQHLTVKLGTCYTNPNTPGAATCVSCMILLYNTQKQDWQEAPDGDNFLENAYDFLQYSEGGEWEAKELSMRIPFDYALTKKWEAK